MSLIEANRPQHPELGGHHKCGRECETSFRWGVRRALLVGADSSACMGIGTHSPAGDSLWRKAAGNTGSAVFAFAASAVA